MPPTDCKPRADTNVLRAICLSGSVVKRDNRAFAKHSRGFDSRPIHKVECKKTLHILFGAFCFPFSNYNQVMIIYDITRKIAPSLAVWPGDKTYHHDLLLSKAAGASVNLTTLHLSAHTGTHADAWWHYEQTGDHPATMPLEKYIGAARVVTVQREDGGITPDEIAGIDFRETPRVLFKSHVSDLSDEVWPDRFPYLRVELIDVLAKQGVVLIGLDSPSVDAFDSKDLPCHHRLFANKMVNLETLYLRDVPDGVYELVALPLKLDNVCASPVRAILRAHS
jgi:arylformamidase